MKILFFGDSVTDASRRRGSDDAGRVKEEHLIFPTAYGSGYVFLTAAELAYSAPCRHEILNRGIGGDRLPQLYARIGLDVWSEKPDLISILVGVNDVARPDNPNSTDLERWGRIYRMMIRDTMEKCPNAKLIICEPFSLRANDLDKNAPEETTVLAYAKEARRIAEEFSIPFVPLQEKISAAAEAYGNAACLHDNIHPNLLGSKIISTEWLKVFRENFEG